MVNRGCPAFTGEPSWYRRFSRIPVTRARTSTSLDPCVWPTYSKAAGKSLGETTSVVTWAGGGAKPAWGGLPQPASSRIETSIVTKYVAGKGLASMHLLLGGSAGASNATALAGHLHMLLILHTITYVCKDVGRINYESNHERQAMARRTKKEAAVTREQLLDAAERVFRERGVTRTSLTEVATAAGLTRGAVYWHFKDKAALFAAMCERATLPLDAMLTVASGEATDEPLAVLRDLMVGALRHLGTDP